jgi:hypothetical protein
VSETFSPGDRVKMRSGSTSDYCAEDVFEFDGKTAAKIVEQFDARLAAHVAADEGDFLHVVNDAELRRLHALAVSALRGLKRLEVLTGESPPEGADREQIVFEALHHFDDFARTGGPLVLPFRAQLRRFAFPGRAGEALALLDLARARRAIENGRGDDVDDYFDYALYSLFATEPSGQVPELAAPLRDQLRDLTITWGHYKAVKKAVHAKKEENGHDIDEAGRLDVLSAELGATLEQRPYVWTAIKGVDKLLGKPSLRPTVDDVKRVRSGDLKLPRVQRAK